MRRPVVFLPVALVAFAMACFADAPPISDEVILDHGFRYVDRSVEDLGEKRCAVAIADSSVLIAFRLDGVLGYRRLLQGEEVDINAKSLVDGSFRGSFDLSPFDGYGWKMVYLSDGSYGGCRSLWIRNLDRETLESTMGDVQIVASGDAIVQTPVIAPANDHHVVAWAEVSDSGRSLKLTRIPRDLELLDETPIEVATNLGNRAIDLAMRETGGLVAWTTSARELIVQGLDANGLPVGETHEIGTVRQWPSVELAVCQLVDVWLLAWTGPESIMVALLDSNGETLPPGARPLSGPSTFFGLDVCAADSVGLIAWRRGAWYEESEIVAIMVSSDGSLLAPGLSLDTYAPFDDYMELDEWDSRNVACAWTGESFVVIWNSYRNPPVGGSENGSSMHNQTDWCYGGSPVWSQWITLDGELLYGDPLLVSQESWPRHIGAFCPFGDQYLALTIDGSGLQYIHTFGLDQHGQPTRPANRYRTPISLYRTCDCWWECVMETIMGLVVRPFGQSVAALYRYNHYYSGYDYWTDSEYVIVDFVAPDGELVDRIQILVDTRSDDHPCAASSFDLARGEDSYVVAYSAGRNRYWGGDTITPYVKAKRRGLDGVHIRTWHVVSDSACTAPSIVALQDQFLMLWVEESNGQTTIQKTILDPSDPNGEVSGAPLVPSFGVHGAPHLVPGPSQVLCLFPADLSDEDPPPSGPTGYDIYALRFDLSGAQLDPEPIPLCQATGNQGNVYGVWDSNQYLITWSNTDEGTEAIFGGRIDSDGITYDGDGFLIADGWKGTGQLTSDPVGNVAMAYGKQRIRIIEDIVPLLDDDYWPWEDDPVEPDSTTASQIWIGRPAPNPNIGGIHLDMVLPDGVVAGVTVLDATGRRVLVRGLSGGEGEQSFTWDGLLPSGTHAPAGVYYIRVNVGGRDVIRKALLLR